MTEQWVAVLPMLQLQFDPGSMPDALTCATSAATRDSALGLPAGGAAGATGAGVDTGAGAAGGGLWGVWSTGVGRGGGAGGGGRAGRGGRRRRRCRGTGRRDGCRLGCRG